MIKIRHSNLTNFAFRHLQALKKSLENAQEVNKLEKQNERIRTVFGEGYDFDKIILAHPSEMELLIHIWNEKASENHFKGFSYYETSFYSKFSFGTVLRSKNNKNQEEVYNSLRLIEDLGIQVCPYCNRNFINNTTVKGRKTCDIDHFFPKKKFPFLAVSFYNLIPCCKFCNFVKLDSWNLDKDSFLVNPYDDRFNFEATFQVKILNSKFYYQKEGLNIEFSNPANRRVENHIKAFHLDKLYSNHTDYALELIQKKYIYNESYLDQFFHQYEGTLFKNREEMLRLVTANYLEETNLLQRPLAKLTQDIINQMDL